MPKPIYTSALNTANFKAASQVLFSEHRFKFGKEKKAVTFQIYATTHSYNSLHIIHLQVVCEWGPESVR